MRSLKFGWSEIDITPKNKIALAGEFFERVSSEVETPITVTCLMMQNGDKTVAFCSVDVVSVSGYLLRTVREKITNPNVNKENIIISAVHTHNSYTLPSTDPNEDKKYARTSSFELINKYKPEACEYVKRVESAEALAPELAHEFVSDKIALAIEKAYENLADGGYKPAFGRVPVGMSRRVCYNDGTAKMWGDVDTATFTELEAGNDNGMELLFIYDKNGKMTGVVSNVACPSQVMEQRSVISSDYWGKVKILLRKQYGEELKLLALCSAAGDLCPRDLIRWVEPETPILDPNVIRVNPKFRRADPSMFDVKGTWLIGKRIVNEINLILEETAEQEIIYSAELKAEKLNVRLPLRRVSETDKINAEKAIKEFFKGKTKVNYIDSAELYVHTGTLNRYEIQELVDSVETEVQIIKLGDVAFASNPFELFLNYANEIRARSKASQTFIIQLANGSHGYLPTERAEKHGHYSAYVTSGKVGHVGGDMLVRETLEGITKLFEE